MNDFTGRRHCEYLLVAMILAPPSAHHGDTREDRACSFLRGC
jgi:hypothetical protein